MELTKYEVPVEQLHWYCDPSLFDFECTKDLAPLQEFIGQDRAIHAIEFGLSMDHDGYNIYVAGLTGTGKTSMVKTYLKKLLERKQAEEPTSALLDWCYLYNFDDADRAQIISLPKGKGGVFEEQMGNLLKRVKEELTKAFSSEEYKNERTKAVEEGQTEQRKIFEEIDEMARKNGFVFQMSPIGPVLIPAVEGKPMSQEEYMALPEKTRKSLEEKRPDLLKKLRETAEKAREIEIQTSERLQNFDKEIGKYTVSRLFDPLLKEYQDSERIIAYLNKLRDYTLDSLNIFKGTEEINPVFGVPTSQLMMGGRDPFLPYKVNVFVDNSKTEGPPVIIESNPNYANLFGKIERRFLLGGYLSDHSMLKPGAMHLANGGYLLLSAKDVLTNPAVWPTLKRAIRNKEVRIEDPYEQVGLFVPQGLKPEPMPVEVKVVLIGDAMLYQVLSMYDDDFWELFRVKADFDYQLDRTKENMVAFAAFVAGCCEDCKIHHFHKTGVGKVVEYASRMVADQEKLSSRFAQIKELVEEAEYWSRKEGSDIVYDRHVEKAVESKLYRHNLPDERIRELITRGIIMIDTDGAVAGQVNGLSVYTLGDISFGKPSRITCQTFLGRSGVINIERESELSGPIHNKGVLILGGYMGWKYAQNRPLSLSASLCFEQSYEGVEGDSASSTELYALLSSLSEVPIKQGIAVTGSVNQRGEIQPIGGINQKIEGYFQVCKYAGLNGTQGVLMPQKNLKNLMLRQEVVDAVKAGKFHIYAVGTIDEGISILTGVDAGERKADGAYPEGTINYLVDRKLEEMATKLRYFTTPEEKGEKKETPAAVKPPEEK